MFDYDRKERTSWGLTLTQPFTGAASAAFFLVKSRRAATGQYTKFAGRFFE
jgi:hypothetical protein